MNITDKGAKWFYDYVWLSETSTALRDRAAERKAYYDGQQAILTEDSVYANGQPKGQRVMNWIKEVIKRHTGCMTPYQVTPRPPEEGEEITDISPYQQVQSEQRILRLDSLLTRDALLCGYGVEFVSYDETPQVNYCNPSEWAFLWDTDDKLSAAVRLIVIPENAIHKGEVLEEETTKMYIYTDEEIAEFTNTAGPTEWTGEIEANQIGVIPVIVWASDNELKGIIPDELIGMNDEFNAAFNRQGDDIRNVVDCLVKFWGLDSTWMTANETTILEKRMLPFDGKKDEQDAEYLQRTMDIVPHTRHLTDTRENIHIMGSIPDVLRILGASGSTSGIALKLMFTPMQQAFESYAPFLTEGIYSRLNVMNAYWAANRRPQITNVNVDVQFVIPTNRIEEWQNVKNLDGIVSHKTQLRLLSDIEDPEAELEAVVREMGEDTTTAIQQRLDLQEAQAQALEGQLIAESQRTTEAVAQMIQGNDALATKILDGLKAAFNG